MSTDPRPYQYLADKLEAHASDFAVLQTRVDTISRDLKTNTEATRRVEENTAELVELFRALQGWLKVAGWLGKGMEWAIKVGAFLAAFWGVVLAFKLWLHGGK